MPLSFTKWSAAQGKHWGWAEGPAVGDLSALEHPRWETEAAQRPSSIGALGTKPTLCGYQELCNLSIFPLWQVDESMWVGGCHQPGGVWEPPQ